MTPTYHIQPEAPVAVEAGLLALFAATPRGIRTVRPPRHDEHASLWRYDAVHRAKNMAQLSTSLANIVEHPSHGRVPAAMATQARSLSRVYAELGAGGDEAGPVPCARMLGEVAVGLTRIFGTARNVAAAVSVDAVFLPPAKRRALVLMASELVINALKYGYPTAAGGTVAVALHGGSDGVAMTVEDDGVGDAAGYAAGHGGGLIEAFCAILGATMTRTAGHRGHGFRVSVSFPADRQVVVA